jgi:RimJ/RimL family protein N-acetyltransferase
MSLDLHDVTQFPAPTGGVVRDLAVTGRISKMDFGGLWPLATLRLRVGEYELRLPTGTDLSDLIPVRAAEIARNRSLGARKQEFALLQGEIRAVADWLPDRWRLSLAVVFRGDPVGLQALIRGSHGVPVTTDSWIAETHRGRGHGTSARRAVLVFARDFLHAETAIGRSSISNQPSAALNRKLGYSEDYDHESDELCWFLDLRTWDDRSAALEVLGWNNEVRFLLGVDADGLIAQNQ